MYFDSTNWREKLFWIQPLFWWKIWKSVLVHGPFHIIFIFIMFLYKTHIKVKFLVKVYGRKIICKGLKNQNLFWLMKTQKRFRFLRITAPENVLFRVLWNLIKGYTTTRIPFKLEKCFLMLKCYSRLGVGPT